MSFDNKNDLLETEELWKEGLSEKQSAQLLNIVRKAKFIEYEKPVSNFNTFKVPVLAFSSIAVACLALFVFSPVNQIEKIDLTEGKVMQSDNVLEELVFLQEIDTFDQDQIWIDDLIETL